jgi:hypothetical protein
MSVPMCFKVWDVRHGTWKNGNDEGKGGAGLPVCLESADRNVCDTLGYTMSVPMCSQDERFILHGIPDSPILGETVD